MTVRGHGWWRRRTYRLLVPVVLVAAVLLYFVRIGYIGGTPFSTLAVTGPAAPGERGTAAVLISGDMGFNVGMGPDIAAGLAAKGIPVVAVNSLTFFRHRRSPADVQRMVADAGARALALPGIDRVVMIGQSFGADMLHVGLAALPAGTRARVALVVLMVPAATVEYRASPTEIFSRFEPAFDAWPTARALGWSPVLCVYGVEEEGSLCPRLSGPRIHRAALPGGHPLRHDTDAVLRVLLPAIADATAPRA